MKLQLFGANFKPVFWSKYCQTELAKDLVIGNWCDYQFDGEIKKGSRLTIVGANKPVVKDYNKVLSGEEEWENQRLADNSQYLDIEFADYFSFIVEDIEKSQSNPEYLTTQFNESKVALAETEDKTIARVAAEGANKDMVSTSTKITIDNALSTITAGILKLYKNDVKAKTELAADLTPEHIMLAKEKMSNLFSENVDYIKNSAVGKYNNCYLRMTNDLYNDGTDSHELIRTKKAVAVANGIDELKTCDVEDGFGTKIKGLNVYGIKVVRPKELYVIKAHA